CVGRQRLASSTRVHSAKRERLVHVSSRGCSRANELQEPGRKSRERQQIQSVVLENGRQWTSVATADESKVAGRNLVSRHVGRPPRAQNLPFERGKRTSRFGLQRDPFRVAYVEASLKGLPYGRAPETSSRVQDVDVR